MVANSAVRLRACGHALEMGPDRHGQFQDSTALLSDTDALRHQIAEQGHLFLPGFLDRQRVLEVRGALLKKLAERGAIDLTFPLMDGVSHPDYNDIEAHQLTRANTN